MSKGRPLKNVTRWTALLLCFALTACSGERYDPQAEAGFFFHTPGASHTFIVRPKWFSATEIVLNSKGQSIPMPQTGQPRPFEWTVVATAYRGDTMIEEIKLKEAAWWFQDGGVEFAKSVSLGTFKSLSLSIPLETKIVVKVISIDPHFSSPDPSLSVAVRASPIP